MSPMWGVRMTPLPPGRELDALIAEKVMGWNKFTSHPEGWTDVGEGPWFIIPGEIKCEAVRSDEIPAYSTDIAAAWEVVEKMRVDGFNFQIHNVNEQVNWVALFWKKGTVGDPYLAVEVFAPHAICLAALKPANP